MNTSILVLITVTFITTAVVNTLIYKQTIKKMKKQLNRNFTAFDTKTKILNKRAKSERDLMETPRSLKFVKSKEKGIEIGKSITIHH